MRKQVLKLCCGVLALATIVVCGGGDTIGGSYPLHRTVNIGAVNNDSQPIHIYVTGEAPDPSNRVPANDLQSRTSTSSFTWNTALDARGITVTAYRNNAVVDTAVVNITGEERLAGAAINATFNANQTLTAVKTP